MSGRLLVLCGWTALVACDLVVASGQTDTVQAPLQEQIHSRKLTGRFLQITDIHPDPFFKYHSDPEHACHRKKGNAGYYGAQTSDCDSPIPLVNATFDWIRRNIKNEVDFVVWTGDSARHDNDEHIPRSQEQVISQNELLIEHIRNTFGDQVPVIPTLGNNDILPHNLFSPGPNKWTKHYSNMWKRFIPEPQRHQFARGGWFYVEVIPDKLAVFSLNTLYFFSSNAVVDGCASSSEPGYEQFEWLRIQLQMMRERGVKAILIGHVPPARNDAKSTWDETCWQKYGLWLRQYRDVIVGSMYGHMNIDHFIVQDFNDIKYDVLSGETKVPKFGDISLEGTQNYLMELRKIWSKLPLKPSASFNRHREHHEKYINDIGGPYAERFAVSLVSPSVVPNYFPTLRLYEYNISGLDALQTIPSMTSSKAACGEIDDFEEAKLQYVEDIQEMKHRKKKKGNKKKKRPKFAVPLPPSRSAPPGPAYSSQLLSLVSVKQLYANLTFINNDKPLAGFDSPILPIDASFHIADTQQAKKPNAFAYELEYDTGFDRDIYKMDDGMSVLRWVQLAGRIGKYKADKGSILESDEDFEGIIDDLDGQEPQAVVKDEDIKKGKKHKKRKIINKTWYAFVDRATVATMDEDDLHRMFGDEID